MLNVDITSEALAALDTSAIAIGVFADDERLTLAPGADALVEALGVDLVAELSAAGFDGSVASTLPVPTRGTIAAGLVIAVGLGAQADAGREQLRLAAAAAVAASERHQSLATSLADAGTATGLAAADAAQAVAEGLLLGAYRYTEYRSDAPPFDLQSAVVHADAADLAAAQTGVEVARVTAGAAALARDLVNTPPQDKRPPALADRAAQAVDGLPIDVKVLDEAALAEGGYGGILGVGQGSSEPPRLVELTYTPANPKRHVAFVGKGITFDTGGISLKPSAAMETMKMDMAGAATVLAVVKAAAQLELDVKVTALMALAENMPSGTATRVSDVLTMKGGTTVEVINTDAEGRLVLGDALVHAGEASPDAIIDVATLTGAQIVALGDKIGAVIASDDELADQIKAAGVTAGESHWPLPLATAEYGDRVEGTIADLKNSGGREAGTVWAALFLSKFVPEGTAWAHLDVAGTAWTDKPAGYISKGGTGVPVRTLIEWLRTA